MHPCARYSWCFTQGNGMPWDGWKLYCVLTERVLCPPTELRRALFSVFSSCGRILEVVVARTYKLRGQAWIVYDREHEAQRALQALQGFPFYDKPMVRFQSFPSWFSWTHRRQFYFLIQLRILSFGKGVKMWKGMRPFVPPEKQRIKSESVFDKTSLVLPPTRRRRIKWLRSKVNT